MQTFLPNPLYKESARVLDNKRLGKQRVECLQILKVLRTGPIQNSLVSEGGFKYKDGLYQRKTPWYNHPAVRMWDGYEKQLAIYGLYICYEWINRGFKDSCFQKIESILKTYDPFYKFRWDNYIDYSSKEKMPSWLGNESFHISHRSNLLRKFPHHYRQYWPTDPDNLPYVWPVQKKGV